MLEKDSIESGFVPGPVEYATLRPGTGPSRDLPIMLWLHGGGGSARFLESCQPQFVSAWQDGLLPDVLVVTPSAGWSYYLDRRDGGERWERFLLDELVPHLRKVTGSTTGPLLLGGISIGAAASLRIAFKHPELVTTVAGVEPTIEAATNPEEVPQRDLLHLPRGTRARLFGDPIDSAFWRANHPVVLARERAAAIAANELAIYFECGDRDLLNAQFGAELLHRQLFDSGISHEYRHVRGGNHVGPTVGPRILDALRFVGGTIKPAGEDHALDSIVEVETFATQVRDLEDASGYRSVREVQGPDGALVVHAQGEGPRIVMLPSLGRTAADFADLADRLARAGFCALRPEPRGLDGRSALQGVTLDHFADDIAAVIDAFGGPAAIVGHDFGGQVAQMVAYLYPDLVSSLVLLAAPGPVPARPEPATALRRIFVPELSHEEHLEAVALALFAEGNDPVAWVGGWHPNLAFAQAEAERHMPAEELWSKLRREALVLQPAEDLIVSPENARRMAAQLGDLVTVVEVPRAGHALLPEQPAAVAAAILSWLRSHR